MGVLIILIIGFILLSIYACLKVASKVDREDENKTFNNDNRDEKTKRRNKRYVIEKFSDEAIRLAESSPERMRDFHNNFADRMRNTERLYNCCFHLINTYEENGYHYYIYEEFHIGEEDETNN